MKKQIHWLREQIDLWVRDGLISAEQADRIRPLYPEPKAGVPWGTLLFSGLGATIIGLGIILLFAYNWDRMPKEAKLAVIFGGLAAAHAGGIRLLAYPDWRRQLGESFCVLGTMLFGAGIWLVAQIYHIDEHFPNGFLIWGLGATAMAWVLASQAHGLLALVVLCVWNASEAWDFHRAIHWGPIFIVLSTGILAYRHRWRLLFFLTLAGFSLVLLANTGELRGNCVFPAAMSLAAVFISLSEIVRRRQWFAETGSTWGFFGWLGFILCGYILSFHAAAEDLLRWHGLAQSRLEFPPLIYLGTLFAAMLAGWGAVAGARLTRGKLSDPTGQYPIENWMVPLAAGICLIFWLNWMPGFESVLAGIFNLVLLALAVAWMARGCWAADLGPLLLGSLLLVALAIGRFFDLFESLVGRGLIFVVVGGLLFTEGIFYTRARQRLIRKEEVA